MKVFPVKQKLPLCMLVLPQCSKHHILQKLAPYLYNIVNDGDGCDFGPGGITMNPLRFRFRKKKLTRETKSGA